MLPEIVIGVPVRETEVYAFGDRLNEKTKMLKHYKDMIRQRDNQIQKQHKEIYDLQMELERLKLLVLKV